MISIIKDNIILIIVGIAIFVFVMAIQRKSDKALDRKEEEEKEAIAESRNFEEDTQKGPEMADMKLMEYARKAGLAVGSMLTSDIALQKAIASEVSVMFFVLQDGYQAATGNPYERRANNLGIMAAVYWKSFNAAFGLSSEESGRFFDERQEVFVSLFRELPGFSEAFLEKSERYLEELISWMISRHEPSHYNPCRTAIRDSFPVCMDLMLKHRVHVVVSEVLGSRIPEFLMMVANSN